MARNVNKYVQKVFTILDEEVKEDTNRNRIINTDRKVWKINLAEPKCLLAKMP